MIMLASGAEPPNLSGVWRFSSAKSELGPNYPAYKSRVDTVEHRDPDLKLQTVQEREDGGKVDGSAAYRTDGKETINDVSGNALKSVARWEGAALVMETTGNFGERRIKLADRWTLWADGKTLLIERTFEKRRRARLGGEETRKFAMSTPALTVCAPWIDVRLSMNCRVNCLPRALPP